ncbi:hypothetical protein J2S14_002936 [Lederbergia wuyishanensis]|uniref:Uncharacterized protein n=1 Tax=Lederbergia wuyishanensis TaxID=1347903 RepID=A0ABU0D6S9_9BACI|nr:hypothetical protein [Lederbergia wuyishanensis]
MLILSNIFSINSASIASDDSQREMELLYFPRFATHKNGHFTIVHLTHRDEWYIEYDIQIKGGA